MKSAAAVALLPAIDAHSWLHCMKFLGEVPRPRDDESLCQGWPRGWPAFARNNGNRAFGQDIGRDNRPGRDVTPTITCDRSEGVNGEAAYGADGTGGQGHGPRAIIKTGAEFVATWPAKNHCDVGSQRGCQMFFTVVKGGPTEADDFASPLTAVGGNTAGFEAAYPGLTRTYSKCTPQRGGIDRAFCYGRYEMPTAFQEGYYGFMWWWEFNRGEHYNSCVGVYVVDANGANAALADAQGTAAPPPPAMGGGMGGGDPPTPPTPAPGGAQCATAMDGPTNNNPFNCGFNFDCTQFHNCCPDGYTCWRKNQFYAGCRNDGCAPGQNNPNDPPQFQTPWECQHLGGVCTEQTRANSVMASSMEMDLFVMNSGLTSMMTEMQGMDPQMKAFQAVAQQMGPEMAMQMVPIDPAMMPPGMGPATPPMTPPVGAPMTPPMMPPAAPVAPVAPAPVAPVAPVARPPVATPPAAVSGAFKSMAGLLATLPLLQLLR